MAALAALPTIDRLFSQKQAQHNRQRLYVQDVGALSRELIYLFVPLPPSDADSFAHERLFEISTLVSHSDIQIGNTSLIRVFTLSATKHNEKPKKLAQTIGALFQLTVQKQIGCRISTPDGMENLFVFPDAPNSFVLTPGKFADGPSPFEKVTPAKAHESAKTLEENFQTWLKEEIKKGPD
jgi:hypothetical protein